MDSPLSSNAENSHPQCSLGLAPSFQRSLSELSPRPRLAPASQLWLAKPNGGQGNKQEERQQSRSGIIARWQIQRVRFWFLHFPRLGKPQSYMATKFGWETDWVFQSNSLFGVLFPPSWANYALLNQHWTPWGLLGHHCLGESHWVED